MQENTKNQEKSKNICQIRKKALLLHSQDGSFAASNRFRVVEAFVSAHVRDMSLNAGGIQDILKKASYALCFGYLESGKFIKYQNIAARDAHWYVNNVRAWCAHFYIRRGLQCCCLVQKAIPEPQIAEQQDCSPAFIITLAIENRYSPNGARPAKPSEQENN